MYYGLYSGKLIVDYKIITQAVRLVIIIVITYNTTIFNILYIKLTDSGCSEKKIQRFLRISPIALVCIAFIEIYTFNNKHINLNKIITTLE